MFDLTQIFFITKIMGIDRAHFHKFVDSALVFEVVYYVETGDYTKYMDIQEKTNLAIHEQSI